MTVLALAPLFDHGVVLQRDVPVPVWGTGVPGHTVNVELLDVPVPVGAHAEVAPDGTWRIDLPASPATPVGHGATLLVSDLGPHEAGSTPGIIRIEDVALGEVWLAGGQSNIEYHLGFDAEFVEEYGSLDDTVFTARKKAKKAGQPDPAAASGGAGSGEEIHGPEDGHADIRMFDQPKIAYPEQIEEHDYSLFGHWRFNTAIDRPYFTAAPYYAALELAARLEVVVGIVGCSWGGTPAVTWADPEDFTQGPQKVWLEDYAKESKDVDPATNRTEVSQDKNVIRPDPFDSPIDNHMLHPGYSPWKQKRIARKRNKQKAAPMGPSHPKRPGGLFESMVEPLAPFAARGVLWYQGESDATHPEVYAEAFSAVIRSWRRAWGTDLPFVFAQLAPYGTWLGLDGDDFPTLRAQQQKVADTVEKAWMISTSDAGMRYDIHPKHKRPVGERIALAAAAHVYGLPVEGDAPEAATAGRDADGYVVVTFRHAEGLHADGKIADLRIVTPKDKKLRARKPQVSDGRLRTGLKAPVGSRVEFAQTGWYEVGIRNRAGIPATPFVLDVE